MSEFRKSALRSLKAGLTALTLLAGAGVVTGSWALGAGGKPMFEFAKPVAVVIEAQEISQFEKPGALPNDQMKLIWRGGLVLSAPAATFGGYSGLLLSPDGKDLLAVSDAGGWLKARIEYQAKRPAGLSDAVIGSLTARDGKPFRRNHERDAEGLALTKGQMSNGEVLISFENFNRLVRYSVSAAGIGRPHEVIAAPKTLGNYSENGMEAITELKGGPHKGATIAFTETAGRDGRHSGWIWTDGAPKALQVVSRGGFSLTDAISLQDGTLILLERRFTFIEGVRMRLRRVPAVDVVPGALLDGEVLIEADLTDEIDNMEGLAVHTSPSGETVLTLISDDNFNPVLQRTLLLQFTLPDRPQS